MTVAKNACMDTTTVRKQLLAQHDRIRADLVGCWRLAQRLRGGAPVSVELELAIAQLQSDFDDHNRAESELLAPLLLHESQDRPTRGRLLVERMIEEHLAEHGAFRELLRGPVLTVAANMEEVVDELEAHMAAEERTFLSPLILQGDALRAVTQGVPR
jgi:iron-sulfur cluster repair protein YtfE (RIC family)